MFLVSSVSILNLLDQSAPFRSRFLWGRLSACSRLLAGALFLCAPARPAALRVCADPNNLPFSNIEQQGFENNLAQMAAQDLGRSVEYVWISRRGGDLKSLAAGLCDVLMGTASVVRVVPVTHPYYRSTYVFVSRPGRDAPIHSFNDPRLRQSRIGLEQVLGADDADVPPARALAGRGLLHNIAWYRLRPNFIQPNDGDVLIRAVEKGNVDVAIAWGPVAGYYARKDPAVEITPVSPQSEHSVAYAFDISMGVRPGDPNLKTKLDAFIMRRKSAIRGLLRQYGVPLVQPAAAR